MSILTHTVSIPLWLLVLLFVIMAPTLVRLFKFLLQFKQASLKIEDRENQMAWTMKNRLRSASPKLAPAASEADKKEQQRKKQLVQMLKILFKEGDKGVLMKTVADRMETSILEAQHAMNKLMERKLVEEVSSVSGTKYYLTQAGKEYCRRKAQ